MDRVNLPQKILVATDFSSDANAALKQAISLAHHSQARITLVHVTSDIAQSIIQAATSVQMDLLTQDVSRIQRDLDQEALHRLRHVVRDAQKGTVSIECKVLRGDPAVAITREAHSELYDLVLVGTRWHSRWERFVVGSTAKRLIRKCPVAVWTVNAKSHIPFKKVLIATDFSEASHRAAEMVLPLAVATQADVQILHIIDSQNIAVGVVQRMTPDQSLRELVLAEAEKSMAKFVQNLNVGDLAVRTDFTWGIPAQDIARIAQYHGIDLLVMGSVGRTGLKGILLGNTAEKLLESCDCSVLTTKPAGFVSPIELVEKMIQPNGE